MSYSETDKRFHTKKINAAIRDMTIEFYKSGHDGDLITNEIEWWANRYAVPVMDLHMRWEVIEHGCCEFEEVEALYD